MIDTCPHVILYHSLTPVVWRTNGEVIDMERITYEIRCTLPAGHDDLHEVRTAEGRVIRWR